MKTLCWNCQGIGGSLTVHALVEQVRLHNPDVVLESSDHSMLILSFEGNSVKGPRRFIYDSR